MGVGGAVHQGVMTVMMVCMRVSDDDVYESE